MSNYLAVAVITAAIREIVQGAVHQVVPGAIVCIGPPRAATPGEKEVNIYLHRLSANAFNRNDELPLRSSAGALHRRPELAVDLHYVISFSGDRHLESEVMLGKVASVFHAWPVLGFEELAKVVRAGAAFPFLERAFSVPHCEKVTLTPEYLSLDELSKLWTVFFQITHRPSLQYVVSPVLIQADLEPDPVPAVDKVEVGGG